MPGDNGYIQSGQIVNDAALDELGNTAGENLITILPELNTRVKEPLRLSVTGSSSIVTIGTSIIATGPAGKRHGLPIIAGVDLGAILGTLDVNAGTGTSAVQGYTPPTMTASYYIRVGFEVRANKEIYAVYGEEASTSADADAPAFSGNALWQIGEILLQDNGTGGVGNFTNPAMSAIIEYLGGGGNNGSINPPLNIYASTPASSVLQINPARMLQGDGGILVAPVIQGNVPNFAASTIDFQAQTTTGGTFDITFPVVTVGLFVLCTLSLLTGDVMEVLFSAPQATTGSLPNPGTQYVEDGIDTGYLYLQSTGGGSFKTAGSTSNIIENAPGGVTAIFRSELSPPRAVQVANYDNIVVDPITGTVVIDPITGTVVYQN